MHSTCILRMMCSSYPVQLYQRLSSHTEGNLQILLAMFYIQFSFYVLIHFHFQISLKPDANVATNESKLVVPASKVAAFYSCQASNQVLNELKKDFLNITLHRVGKLSLISYVFSHT